MRSRRADSSSVSLNTGIPVLLDSTTAISSSPTTAGMSESPCFQASSFSARCAWMRVTSSRSRAAVSKSCASMAASFSIFSFAICSSNSRRSGGAVIRWMRSLAPASSIRSMALSGRNRSWM